MYPYTEEEYNMMEGLEKRTEDSDPSPDVHAEGREASARQTIKAMNNTDRPDIAAAILLRAIDDWYEKGVAHGRVWRRR